MKKRSIIKSQFTIWLFFFFALFSQILSAQNVKEIVVTGIVIDSNGDPLIGANVMVLGSKSGTMTDVSGKFKLNSNNNATLKVSYIGFETAVININNKTSLKIVLKQNTQTVDEVVVIGYGTQRKKDLTGSVAQADMSDLIKAPVATLSDALAGRLAGVVISSNDGQPGQEANIVIRGAGSLTSSTAPLYVVDGFPIDGFNIASLSMENIENVNVLKDASSIAIYGAKGANGVIVITTKKGFVGAPKISFSLKQGYQTMGKFYEMMNPYEYVKFQNEVNPTYMQASFLKGRTLDFYKDIKGVDWAREILSKNPNNGIYDVSLSGGTDKTKFYAAASLFNQVGIIDNSGASGYRLNFSLDQYFNSKTKIGISINLSQNNSNGSLLATMGGSTTRAYTLYRTLAFKPIDQNVSSDFINQVLEQNATSNQNYYLNPVIGNRNEKNLSRNTGTSINSYLEYKPIQDLILRISGSLRNGGTRSTTFNNALTYSGFPTNGNVTGINGSINNSLYDSWSTENTLTYNKTISKDHFLNAMVGGSYQENSNFNFGQRSIQILDESSGIYGLGSGTPTQSTSGGSGNKSMSFFGRVNYTLFSNYLFTFTYRADGSSKFAPENRWGYFPSGAFAWKLGEEKFIKKIESISNLKLRTSYGLIGNSNVGDYDYISQMSTSSGNAYAFNNVITLGANVNSLGNYNLRWEKTKEFDVGFDLGLFKNRIEFIADYYDKRTTDLLLYAQIPTSSGYDNVRLNIGAMQNSGFEFTLKTVNVKNKNFQWISNFNISFNQNKVLGLSDNQTQRFDGSGLGGKEASVSLYITKVGMPAGMFTGLIFDGIYQYSDFNETAKGVYVLKPELPTNGNPRYGANRVQPGSIKYKDLNNDGTITDADMAVLGSPRPIHTGGFTNSFSYNSTFGRISLDVFMQWCYGNKIFNANKLYFEGVDWGSNQFASYVNRWSPTNPSNTMQSGTGYTLTSRLSSQDLEDGSFLRVKTLSIGYDFPEKMMKRLKISNLNINFAAQNLFTFTNYSGLDPEVSRNNSALTGGMDFSAYPMAKIYTLGLRLTL